MRILRKAAERKLAEFMGRVAAVNEDPKFVYRVARVVVFGSYLTNAETLGEIDLAIEFAPRERDPTRDEALRAECYRRRTQAFRNVMDEAYWPLEEVRQYLHTRFLNLHDIEKPVWRMGRHKVIYAFESEER